LYKLSKIILMFASGFLILAACSPVATGPQAWIDHPRNGASAPLGLPVEVISHAQSNQGIAEIVLLVNGVAYRRDLPANPGEPLAKVRQEWLPEAEGTYTLQVTAYDSAGATVNSSPITVQIRPVMAVLPLPATEVPSVTPVPGSPDLQIVSVEAIIEGYKDGYPFCNTRVIYRNAGDATVPTDFNIQFHFNGVPTLENLVAGGLAPGMSAEIIFTYPFEGMPYIGINLDSTNLIAESSEDNNAFAEIRMCGTPQTPTFTIPAPATTIPPTPTSTIGVPTTPADTTPPPVPQPAVPADGLELTCRANQDLVWMPVSDPSGLAGYFVRLERRPNKDASWQAVGEWGPIVDKQHTVTVECGFYYRWSVRARDNAGNTSNWSPWSRFSVLIY